MRANALLAVMAFLLCWWFTANPTTHSTSTANTATFNNASIIHHCPSLTVIRRGQEKFPPVADIGPVKLNCALVATVKPPLRDLTTSIASYKCG